MDFSVTHSSTVCPGETRLSSLSSLSFLHSLVAPHTRTRVVSTRLAVTTTARPAGSAQLLSSIIILLIQLAPVYRR